MIYGKSNKSTVKNNHATGCFPAGKNNSATGCCKAIKSNGETSCFSAIKSNPATDSCTMSKSNSATNRCTTKSNKTTTKMPFNRAIATFIRFDSEPITNVSGDNPIEIDEPFTDFGK